jgi:transposase
VYLHQYQLVPLARTCELLGDLCDCQLSEGTLIGWVQQAAQALEPTVKRIGDWISASRLQHGDETGIRVKGKLHWMHVNSTPWLTHLAWHAKRGKQALEAIGIWPRFHGRGMHDRFASYDQYPCQHSVCAARRPFVTFAALCQRCANKVKRCLPLWPPSLQASHSLSPGPLGSYKVKRGF